MLIAPTQYENMHWLNSRPVSRVQIVGYVVAVQEKELFGTVANEK